ncbi:hypothetical protein, partial [Phaeobacter sp. 11ANDIMAR09]|uniref:hypothetical protein n=1 Tax=Phaeobacter sp. 11ANDIMAR09 TaxID=1225647 RepID=UPI0006D702C0
IVELSSGKEIRVEKTPSNDIFRVNPGAFIVGFSFKPDYAFDAKTLTAIRLRGYPNSDFKELETALYSIDKKLTEIVDENHTLQLLKEDDEEKTEQRASLEREISELKDKKEESQRLEAEASERLASSMARLKDRRSEVANAQETLRELQSDIKKAETDLRRVTKEVRLFPVDQEGFVREGGRNIKNYLLMSIPFVAIICLISYNLLAGAVELSVLINTDDIKIDVWTIFLTRIPFVLLAITLLEVCGYAVGRFIFEMIKINRQRLDIAKLSIIAKDVSDASGYNTDLNDEDLWERNTSLKMELLREHLKEEVGETFSYKGTAAQSALKGAIERIRKGKADLNES